MSFYMIDELDDLDDQAEAFCACYCGPPFTPAGEHAIDCPFYER